MVATMVSGNNATFTVDNGTVMINDANVTTPDVVASNGIIHVIDKVLMPPADEPVEEEPVEEPEEVVDPFEGIDCAATVGIDSSGYAFSQTVVNIEVRRNRVLVLGRRQHASQRQAGRRLQILNLR